jgi:hypothetical protein
MKSLESSTRSQKRPSRARSAPPSRDKPQDPDGDRASLGEVYLDTFDPPALASTSDVYRRVYGSTRAILERVHWRHATTAVKAAYDAAAASVTQALATSGGPEQ